MPKRIFWILTFSAFIGCASSDKSPNCENEAAKWQRGGSTIGDDYYVATPSSRMSITEYVKHIQPGTPISQVIEDIGEPDLDIPLRVDSLFSKTRGREIKYVFVQHFKDNMSEIRDVSVYLDFSPEGRFVRYWSWNAPEFGRVNSNYTPH